MEISFLELCLVGAIFLIIVIVTNVTIYFLNKRLITHLALNCEKELELSTNPWYRKLVSELMVP